MESSVSQNAASAADGPPRLKRLLTVWDLVFFGIVLIQPIAPVGIFGLSSKMSYGHVSLTIVIAMVAMMLTAFSYGRMAALYPSAGSAYTYVSRGLGAHFGFMAGWAMCLDYLVLPLINTVYGSLTLKRMFPAVPYSVWAVLFVVVITFLNLGGIRATARANIAMLAVMTVVIVAFVGLALRYLVQSGGWDHVLSTEPFYNPKTFDLKAIGTATSLAALTYIGFDGVTTLAEEVRDPKRSVLLAVVLVCFITGIFSTVEVYLAQLVWPDYTSFTDPETAFYDVSRCVGGVWLFYAMALIVAVACLGSGLAGQAGAARLLYGMGREGVLPRRIFGHLSAKSAIPGYNVILIGALTLAALPWLNYEFAATLLNFGAFLAFMGVNLATIAEYFFRRREGRPGIIVDLLLPGLGFLFCLAIWLYLPTPAKVAGGIWLLLGLIYDAIKSRGFRRSPAIIDFTDHERGDES
jgi:amino acid transporter